MDNGHYKILIIDDSDNVVSAIAQLLRDKKHHVKHEYTPTDGIDEANPTYDYIFIDFVFENQSLNGTDIGIQVRKKCPLVPLILFTANGTERIQEFIFVGFDAFYDKHVFGEDGRRKMKRLFECIDIAKRNSQRRIKSIFNEEELKSIYVRLDNIEKALLEIKTYNRKSIAGIAKRVAVIEADKDKSDKNEEASMVGQTLSMMFKTAENGNVKTEALKARQLLLQYPDRWPNVRKHFKPVIKLITELIDEGFPLK